jgi:hypothetical protein
MAQTDNANTNNDRYVTIPLGSGPLDQSTNPARGSRGLLQQAQNYVYRRIGAMTKRTGSTLYGPAIGGALAIQSGVRWYRGLPTKSKQMVVQARFAAGASGLYVGNDSTGTFSAIPVGTLPGTPGSAYYAFAFDPALNSDILIIAYGTGAPLRWDGTNPITYVSGPNIQNPFTGVHSWHSHVWYWGDPSYPDTVFASDLNQPESFAFVNSFGGYDQGKGDGDPTVTCIMDVGNLLYVFKQNHIYAIQGYDFVQGEYQFNDEPIVTGIGTPAGHSVAALRSGSVIFWEGAQFQRLDLGSTVPYPISQPIKDTCALAAKSSFQQNFQGVFGTFVVAGPFGPVVLNDVYLCAIDIGSGVCDTIVVYDDYATSKAGDGVPRWTIWTGLPIGAFIPWTGQGDLPSLYMGAAGGGYVSLLGGNPTNDNGVAIPTILQTLRDDAGSPDRIKKLDRIFLESESNAATFTIQADAAGAAWAPAPTDASATTEALTSSGTVGSMFGTAIFGSSTFSSDSLGTRYQSAVGNFNGVYIRGKNITFTIMESSTTSAYEIIGFTWHAIEEPFSK